MTILQHTNFTNDSNKYKINQVIFFVNVSSIMELTEEKNISKEAIFNYIRPVDGIARLKYIELFECYRIRKYSLQR